MLWQISNPYPVVGSAASRSSMPCLKKGPGVGRGWADTHLVPSRATWPRRPRRDGQRGDSGFHAALFLSFLAPVLFPSPAHLRILKCKFNHWQIVWCCSRRPARSGFVARSIRCHGDVTTVHCVLPPHRAVSIATNQVIILLTHHEACCHG